VSEPAPDTVGEVASPAPSAPAFVNRSLVEHFDRIVAERPEAIALEAGRERLSYRQLQSWSAQIADEPQNWLGAGDRPVATLIGHKPAAVAAMLGMAPAAAFSRPAGRSRHRPESRAHRPASPGASRPARLMGTLGNTSR
jgi:acyl-coenzyme A synthetase/AMP-(fatty) acid ligase